MNHFLQHRLPAKRAVFLLVAWLALAGALVGVGELVVHSSWVSTIDRHATSVALAHRSATLNAVMRAVTWLGSWVALVVAALLVGLLVLRQLLPATFLLVTIVAWVGTQGATTLTKHLVRRERPPERLWLVTAHGWSWPSGHAATAALVFTVLAVVVRLLVPATWIKIAAGAVAIAAVAAVGCSRVFLGVHWTTDVIAGIVFVAAWLVPVAVLLGKELGAFPERRTVEPPVSAPPEGNSDEQTGGRSRDSEDDTGETDDR